MKLQADSPGLAEDGAASASAVLNRLRVTVSHSTWRSIVRQKYDVAMVEGSKA
jgi:hypothetical protein